MKETEPTDGLALKDKLKISSTGRMFKKGHFMA